MEVVRKKWWSDFLVRKARWGLSWRGWLAASCAFTLTAIVFLHRVHPFLAVEAPVNAPVLVMEGWLHPPAVSVAAEKFLAGHYEYIVTTGGPVPSGRISVETWADAGAYWLRQTGLPDQNIRRAPAAATDRDRTYQSALGLKRWLRANAPAVRAFNIVTEGAHARRTRLLFQKAFGSEFNVGIIATQNPEYNSRVWWQSSEGVRETLGETIAYIYARFFFSP